MPSYLQLPCLLFDYALFIFSYRVYCLIMPSYLQILCLLFDYAILSSVTVSTV